MYLDTYVLEVEVTPGNVHDSVAFDDIYDKLVEKHPEVKTVVADSAYKTPHICKKVFEDGRELYVPYTRPKTMEGGLEWWKYVYDEYYDCIICPEYQVLKYSTTNRNGYREYKSNPQICANCPARALCTRNKDFIKTVTQHIWKPYVDMAEELRYTERHKRYYKMRKETIERVFADAKEKHGMRYTRYTGLAQVTNWVRLKFAAMNLKKFAIRKWEDTHNLLQILIFCPKYVQTPVLSQAKLGFLDSLSSPSRGTWIEIGTALFSINELRRRPPHGGRGLKFRRWGRMGDSGWSSPSRGTWIEMSR